MRVPLSWLKEYVDIDMPIEQLAQRLTMAGLEVAAIEYVGRKPPQRRQGLHAAKEETEPKRESLSWENIYVGEIIEVKPHPNADRLRQALVNYGQEQPATSVVGAPNINIGDRGQKVALALAGAKLVDAYAKEFKLFTVKPTRLRGVASEAVICSEKELGISDDHTGVLILDDDAPIGAPLAEFIGDIVLELDLTPNLSRCLSIIGVAREVAALTGKRLKIKRSDLNKSGSINDQVEVEIADTDLCSRYSAGLIRDIKIGPAPFWMRWRLILAGMRPINNIVDITNYVMLEWGQPLHAFDYDKLHSKKGKQAKAIIVRRAKLGEKITTLDGVERDLTEDMLLITDGAGPVAIAGVMGGLETEVTEQTRNILLESANFSWVNNRRTSQALKITSEASLRFSRGLPAELTVPALRRASGLMQNLAGGNACGIVDVYPVKQEKKTIELAPFEVKRILGMEVSAERIIGILEALEFKCEKKDDLLKVTVPDHRLDVEIPADLIEEIARVIGYEQIPTTLLSDTLPPQHRNLDLELEERVRDILVGCGLTEVITYSLTNLGSIAKLDPTKKPPDAKEYIKLANPLTSEREYLRKTLMTSILETVQSNLRYTDRIAIFEIGRVYLPKTGASPKSKVQSLPEEPRRLCIALTGPRYERSWAAGRILTDFFDLKGVVEALLKNLGLKNYAFRKVEHPTFHPQRVAALILDGESIGIMGEVRAEVALSFDLSGRIFLAELDLERLLKMVPATRYYEPLPRFPEIIRDIAVVVDEDVSNEQIYNAIVMAGGQLLKQVTLFDLYRGEPIPKEKKSLAYSLTYRAEDRTLTDEEVNEIHQRIQQRLEQELGAQVRGL